MRIIFITDLHIGAGPSGFHQQTRFINGESTILTALRQHTCDLLVLLGDQVESGNAASISRCVDLFAPLDVPTIVCLGNHDVDHPPAFDRWQTALRRWPQATLADAAIDLLDARVLALNNHWLDALGTPRLYWQPGSNPIPTLLPQQRDWLHTQLTTHQKPTILAIHAPPHAIPPSQTGLAKPIHESPAAYTAELAALAKAHPHLRLIISGHNHVCCPAKFHTCHVLSLSAISEVPHQFACIDITPAALTLTVQPLGQLPSGPTPNTQKPWVPGPSLHNLTL